jgi:polyisoprenyl-phosphate glycosyltransferase
MSKDGSSIKKELILAEKHRLLHSDTLISVATVVFNEQKIIREVVTEIHEVLRANFNYFELLVVDLSSEDATVEIVREIQQELPHIRLLVLSRQYSQEIAYAAALENSIGDYVVLLDASYDPPSLIPDIIHKATEGNDVVIGQRKDRKDLSWLERQMINSYYWLTSKILGYPLSPLSSYYRVYSRRAVNSIVRIKSKSRYLKYFSAMMGFKQTSFEYRRINRKSDIRINRGFYSSLSLALDILVSNSSRPLRVAALVGFVASLLNLLFLAYVFVIVLAERQVAEGWISTSIMSATMFFLLFMILAVMSEYIARILNESKEQPLYFLAEEYDSKVNSKVIDRINVV